MSLANLKRYQELLASSDEHFAKGKAIGAENVEGHQEYAKSLGMEFGTEDLAALTAELDAAPGDDEMSLEDLEAVAGGSGRQWHGHRHHHRHHRGHGHGHGRPPWRPFGWIS